MSALFQFTGEAGVFLTMRYAFLLVPRAVFSGAFSPIKRDRDRLQHYATRSTGHAKYIPHIIGCPRTIGSLGDIWHRFVALPVHPGVHCFRKFQAAHVKRTARILELLPRATAAFGTKVPFTIVNNEFLALRSSRFIFNFISCANNSSRMSPLNWVFPVLRQFAPRSELHKIKRHTASAMLTFLWKMSRINSDKLFE